MLFQVTLKELLNLQKEGFDIKRVTIFFLNEPLITYETNTDDLGKIIPELYEKYQDMIGFEIKDLEVIKKLELKRGSENDRRRNV